MAADDERFTRMPELEEFEPEELVGGRDDDLAAIEQANADQDYRSISNIGPLADIPAARNLPKLYAVYAIGPLVLLLIGLLVRLVL